MLTSRTGTELATYGSLSQLTGYIAHPQSHLAQTRNFANRSCLNLEESCEAVAGCASLRSLVRLSLFAHIL